jgi:hypothetical protein
MGALCSRNDARTPFTPFLADSAALPPPLFDPRDVKAAAKADNVQRSSGKKVKRARSKRGHPLRAPAAGGSSFFSSTAYETQH